MRIYLIEDDPATRRMLTRIVEEGEVGHVIGTAESGDEVAYADVQEADIVLVDLLMPGKDGIETIRDLRYQGYTGRFVMISQVENKEMIGDAYQSGIDTYIHKPVNRLEVLAVLKRVGEHLALERSLTSIRHSLSALDTRTSPLSPSATGGAVGQSKPFEAHAYDLLARLGIAGESGAGDLTRLLVWLHQEEQKGNVHWRDLPPLKDLYHSCLLGSGQALDPEALQREIKAMEQRLRRTILQALGHLASIGLTDYANPTFEHYAPRLFDFGDVRTRMQELKQGEKTTKCRLNLKKFLTALYTEAAALYGG